MKATRLESETVVLWNDFEPGSDHFNEIANDRQTPDEEGLRFQGDTERLRPLQDYGTQSSVCPKAREASEVPKHARFGGFREKRGGLAS